MSEHAHFRDLYPLLLTILDFPTLRTGKQYWSRYVLQNFSFSLGGGGGIRQSPKIPFASLCFTHSSLSLGLTSVSISLLLQNHKLQVFELLNHFRRPSVPPTCHSSPLLALECYILYCFYLPILSPFLFNAY